ncbi:MAG TPA: IclR family transcriptional regulator C-terminal domain-containing protein [Ktedonosporobacter sp.]|jgi:IclR family pca regulon transcriptional regulator|nr:IclR family transcriptional regulator C-terminal domain-containing protein [Ktedonosporobacter sp.]
MRGETGPDFIEALARGLSVIRAFGPSRSTMTLSEVAAATGLARPTARRMLLTLEELGYVRASQGGFALTPRVLELGMAYIGSINIWDIARPHMEQLVAHTNESSSIAQLDGSDVVYVARVAVPKIITIAVTIGTRFPALQTSLGKVLLAELPPDELERVLAVPSRSGIAPLWRPEAEERDRALCEVHTRGWALADEHLAYGIRSIAVPLRDSTNRVVAALNVSVHVAETSIETLIEKYLPLLLQTAAAISSDWTLWQSRSQVIVGTGPSSIPI